MADRSGIEYFQYSMVEHTKKPITSQFDILIGQGIIALDHLIKRNTTQQWAGTPHQEG